jgi:hypothetical protein
MSYVYIFPEVAGEHREHSLFDRSTSPPGVPNRRYVFHGWLGDALLKGYRCYILTTSAAEAVRTEGLSGVQCADVEISTDYEYEDLYPNRPLPTFVWLQIMGKPGQDDFGMARNNHLVMSGQALQILSPFGTAHALLASFSQDDGVVPETFTFEYMVSHHRVNDENR